jgi:hypothetical protein
MINCIRDEYVTEDQRDRYLEQVAANQAYIRRYATVVASIPILIDPSGGFRPALSTQVPGLRSW